MSAPCEPPHANHPMRTTPNPPQAIVAGLRESVKDFSESIPGIKSRDVMELVLVTQYFVGGGALGGV